LRTRSVSRVISACRQAALIRLKPACTRRSGSAPCSPCGCSRRTPDVGRSNFPDPSEKRLTARSSRPPIRGPARIVGSTAPGRIGSLRARANFGRPA
jgi:hypothetical protein